MNPYPHNPVRSQATQKQAWTIKRAKELIAQESAEEIFAAWVGVLLFLVVIIVEYGI